MSYPFSPCSMSSLRGRPASLGNGALGVGVGDDAQEEGHVRGVVGQGEEEGHVDGEHGHGAEEVDGGGGRGLRTLLAQGDGRGVLHTGHLEGPFCDARQVRRGEQRTQT